MPEEDAVFLGCAIPTGVGSVLHVAEAKAGQSAVVLGLGGVGLCAVAGAAAAGCYPLIGIDLLDTKLALGRELGATHCLSANDPELRDKIKALTGGGADLAIEATGRPAAMELALDLVRNQGGVAVVVGNSRAEERISIDPKQFNLGKQLRGTWGGDSVPDRDFPRYGRLLQSGRLNVSRLRDLTYRLEDINQALTDLREGRSVRPLVRL